MLVDGDLKDNIVFKGVKDMVEKVTVWPCPENSALNSENSFTLHW